MRTPTPKPTLLHCIYTLLLYLALPLLLARVFWRNRSQPGYANRWQERFGFYTNKPNAPTIWLHAVSLGEVVAAAALVRELHQRYPTHEIIVSTMTATGAARVNALLGDCARHVFAPYDVPFAVHRFLQFFRPSILVLFEVELWPNWLAACQRNTVPVYVMNARLSERSASRYALAPKTIANMLSKIHYFGVQHTDDATRLIGLGASADRVAVLGSVKFDLAIPPHTGEQAKQMRAQLGANRPTWIAASTHEGEETLVISAFRQIKSATPNALLLLVPRHPERFVEVFNLATASGYKIARRSEWNNVQYDTDILVGDTLGELLCYYATADVAFVGGSLVRVGGHNVLEPAALGIPVIVGPHTYNSGWIAEELIRAGGALRIESGAELAQTVMELLRDHQHRSQMAAAGLEYITANCGVVMRMADAIQF